MNAIFAMTIFTVFFLVIRLCFKKKLSAGIRYALWLVLVVRLVFPVPLFESPVSIEYIFDYIQAGITDNMESAGVGILSGTIGLEKLPGLSGSTGMKNMSELSGGAEMENKQGLSGSTGMNNMSGLFGDTGTGSMSGLSGDIGTESMSGLSGETGTDNVQGFSGDTGMKNMSGIPGEAGANSMQDTTDTHDGGFYLQASGETSDTGSQQAFSWIAPAIAALGKVMNGLHMADWLPYVWLTGFLVISTWWVFANVRLCRKLCQGRRRATGERFSSCKLPVYLSSKVNAPCLFGLFHPAIYINEDMAGQADVKMDYILAHEMAHFHHRDHLWIFVRMVLLSVYWYHPLAWVCAYLSRIDCELACDEYAMRALDEKEHISYASNLLTVISHTMGRTGGVLVNGIHSGKKHLKERIRYAMSPVKTGKPTVIMTIILVLSVFLVSCTSAVDKPVNPTPAQLSENDKGNSQKSIEPEKVVDNILLNSKGTDDSNLVNTSVQTLATKTGQEVTVRWQNNTAEGYPIIRWAMFGRFPENSLRALNQYLLEQGYEFQVEPRFFHPNSFWSEYDVYQDTGIIFDIVTPFNELGPDLYGSMKRRLDSGFFYCLDDYLSSEAGQTLWSHLSEMQWKAISTNCHYYFIPDESYPVQNNQIAFNPRYFTQEEVDGMTGKLDELEDILEKKMESMDDNIVPLVYMDESESYGWMNYYGYKCSSGLYCYDLNSESVCAITECDAFTDGLRSLNRLIEKRYLHKTSSLDKYLETGDYLAIMANWRGEQENLVVKNQTYLINTMIHATAVTEKSEHKEEALTLLTLLRTDQELIKRLLGEEGTSYQMTEQNKMKINDIEVDETADFLSFTTGIYQQLPEYQGDSYSDFFWNQEQNRKMTSDEITAHMNQTAYDMPFYGFQLDDADIREQMNRLMEIRKEYSRVWSRDNFEEELEEYYTKLREAGINEVVAKIQRQYDEFTRQKQQNGWEVWEAE